MKITEWENSINNKYKVLSKITNLQDLEAYLNLKSNLLYALKLDDIIVYVNGKDNLITGIFSNDENINREIAKILNNPYFIDLLINKNNNYYFSKLGILMPRQWRIVRTLVKTRAYFFIYGIVLEFVANYDKIKM